MSDFSKSFEPSEIEDKWYRFWEDEGFFVADPHSSKPAYCIILPPPNITGVLHMGHALVDTVQDVLIRWKRMSGFEALWLPGLDHAGISMQTVVERNLIAKFGKRRVDYSREEFLEHLWEWKRLNETHIVKQIKQLGCSCDWTRHRYTMDEASNKAVRTMFKKMFDDGLIYQGDYLVNWDTITQTALADDEVEFEEKDSYLWHFKYPIENDEGFIIVATTRPETMLGDTAVAVAPQDPRYSHLVGKHIVLPFTGRLIPIIEDHYVDPTFGTGAVKITPAHDPNDYEIGLRHHLPMINIMTPDGHINEHGAEFVGMTMPQARKAIVDKMHAFQLLDKTVPHKHRVGLSYRSKAVIEPYLSKQWFIKMEHFKEKLISAVQDKKIKLVPEYWESTYFHWINNLRDWCISRQLWWGHRIPVWHHKDDPTKMICYAGEDLPPEVVKDPSLWYQDEDVLDAWFSSGLWPFSTLGWPEKTPELQKFYPTATLVTGHDILFFWVARMILMGEYALGEVPFKETFLHGLIYGKSYWRVQEGGHIAYVTPEERRAFDLSASTPSDVQSKWEKMSKSKGNIIDPGEMILDYGADALRIALTGSLTHARQIDLDRRRFEECKNFMNKIWNGARFIFMQLENIQAPLTAAIFEQGLSVQNLDLGDRWILAKLNQVIIAAHQHLELYEFDKITQKLYQFFWDEFCAIYLEISKPIVSGKKGSKEQLHNKQKILVIVLLNFLRLIHPITPFITEELFGKLQQHLHGVTIHSSQDELTQDAILALHQKSCMIASYPKPHNVGSEKDIESSFNELQNIVHAIRNIRAEMQIPPQLASDLIFFASSQEQETVKEHVNIIQALVKIGKINFYSLEEKSSLLPKNCSTAFTGNIVLAIPLPQELQAKEHQRLLKEKERLEGSIAQIENQLNNEGFVARAPAHLIEKNRENLAISKRALLEINSKLSTF